MFFRCSKIEVEDPCTAARQRRVKGEHMPLGSPGGSEGGKALQGKGKQNPFRNAAKPESSGDPLQSMPAAHTD